MILRARWVWLGDGHLLENGEVECAAGRVVGVRRARARKVPSAFLSLGFVDAHAHLQLEPLRAAPPDFVAWIRAVVAAANRTDPATKRARAERSWRELVATGTLAVGEIDSSGASVGLAARGRCYREVLGFDLEGRAASRLVAERVEPGTRGFANGLSPHAPYSTSPTLFRRAVATGLPLAIHVAEHPEEVEFLRTGRGPLRELLASLGKLPPRWRPPGLSPVAHLARLGVLSPRTLVVHAQETQGADLELLAQSGAPVVVCPGTIRWFGRTPPPLAAWLRRGLRVALGTDSLASNRELSMLRELALARQAWPEVPPLVLWEMATSAGARAIARPGLARLRPRAPACFVRVALGPRESWSAALEAVYAGSRRVEVERSEPPP